ncbi:MAG: thioredoxin family protein [Ginsengibacter sp.]
MLFRLLLFISLLTIPHPDWLTDIHKAETVAKKENKLILLNFSGSDWCGPCIRLHKEFFDGEAVNQFAAGHLILLNADFPRSKKNQLSKEQQGKNNELADTYNKTGIFPLTVLLNSEGRVLKTWEGYPSESILEFINEINSVPDAHQ